jgi:hypothetical protein
MRTGGSPASIALVRAWRTAAPCCRERPLGGLPLFRLLGDREDRQQAVTDKLQYLAAMALDRDRLRVENSIEHGDDTVARKPVGELREAAQIGGPEDRFDLFTGPRRIWPASIRGPVVWPI